MTAFSVAIIMIGLAMIFAVISIFGMAFDWNVHLTAVCLALVSGLIVATLTLAVINLIKLTK